MAENMGAIYYTVEADTAKLLTASTDGETSLDNLEKQFKRTDKAANESQFQMTKTAQAVKGLGRESSLLTGVMGELTRALAGIVSIKTAVAIIQTAEAYNEMAERIQMATSGLQEYRQVQARLLANANSTYRPLAEAQEVYIRTADSLRSMGYETSEVLDITDSLSYLFVTNAASADRASTAISAYSKAINKGKVEADAWESILAAVPSVIQDIANASGLSAAQVRELGATGDLTARQLNEGLRRSLEANKAASAGMATTVKDAFTALRNNISVYIGEANQAAGVTNDLSSSILKIADAVQNADVNELVREIEGLRTTIELLDEAATEWIQPFMTGTEKATNFLSDSFADGVLATAKEIDGLHTIFTGTVGAIQGIWAALANNIPAFFNNAFQDVLMGSAVFVNSLADLLNKPLQSLGMEGIGHVSWGAGPTEAIMGLTDAAKEGWAEAAQSAGAYEKVADRLSRSAINRAITDWEEEYGEAISKTTKNKDRATIATGKLSAAAKKLAKDQEANKNVIDKLAASLLEAGLKGEALALSRARAQLNQFATPEEVAQVEALARALYELEQTKSQRAKFGDTGKEADQYIMGDVQPLSGGSFDEQFARYEAEAKLEEERYAAQQERLKSARKLQVETAKSYDQIEEDAARQHADRMAQIDKARYQTMLASGEQGFGALADAMRESRGEQSGAYKAMFATAKAFAVAQAALNLGTALGNAFQLPWPANIAAAGAAAGYMASVIASISSVSMAGGRQYGGGVDASKMYRVNENGAPEILNTASGQQYLLPNSRGEVVSNKDATRGSSAPVNISVVVNNAPQGTQAEARQVGDSDYIVSVIVGDIRTGGRSSQAIEATYGTRRIGS